VVVQVESRSGDIFAICEQIGDSRRATEAFTCERLCGGSMPATCLYVLAVLGESPAVLTELVWWLFTRERASIAGMEVWATGRGDRRLRQLAASETWARLESVVGRLPPLLPAGAAPSTDYGVRCHVLTREGLALDDVRTAADAGAVAAALHDRVRDVRHSLPQHIRLVGSLAGGRKTVSAALQTAFSLQARARDRLVHVLLDHELESWLRRSGRIEEYAFPETRWAAESGVPIDRQVDVYDVDFPALRGIVSHRLDLALDREPYEQVWPRLREALEGEPTATLTRDGRGWTYQVRTCAGVVQYEKGLTRRCGSVLAAIANTTGDSCTDDILRWLRENDVGWRPATTRGADSTTMRGSVDRAMSHLRQALSDMPGWLDQFAPPPSGYRIPARVEVIT
jgi:CRISPR-associated protein (TIGR02584 family)